MAEVAKVPERKRRSVSCGGGDTTSKLDINREELWELQQILSKRRLNAKQKGPEPEDGAGPGNVGASIHEIRAGQQ